MVNVPLRHIGGLDVYDIVGICEPNGFGGLPYPFWQHERRWPLKTPEEIAEAVSRFENGSLRNFAPWLETYRQADIWIECRVEPCTQDAVDKRIIAHRKGDRGFVASQRAGTDAVEIFELDPLSLGTAIAESVGLDKPGSQTAIQIPGYLDNFIGKPDHQDRVVVDRDDDDDSDVFGSRGLTMTANVSRRRETRITDYDQVMAMGTLQSRCDASVGWGLDWDKTLVVWVRIKDDGDYVFSPDLNTARPVTIQTLAERINDAIAENVATLRARRGLS